MSRYGKIKKLSSILLLTLTAICYSFAQNTRTVVEDQIYTDTLGIKAFQKEELKSNDFYDRILNSKSGLVRWIGNLLIGARSSADDAIYIPSTELNQDYFERFSGKTIADIYIDGTNIFGQTTADDLSWSENTLNKLHVQTKKRVIRKNLMFKTGDTINAYRMSVNEQFLRNKPYLATAFFIIIKNKQNPDAVDVYVFVRDNWSISAGGALGGAPYLDVFDRNFIGTGNSFLVRYYAKAGDQQHGAQIDYKINNLWGTFADATIRTGVGATNNAMQLIVDRNFIMPSDHIWGLRAGYYKQNMGMPIIDTTMAVKTSNWGAYYGYSASLNQSRGIGLYSILSIDYNEFNNTPVVTPFSNPYFSNRFDAMMSLGISGQQFFQGNLIYGFGRTEDIPYGFKAELLGGWEDNQSYGRRWYVGAEARLGMLTKLGYFDMGIKGGTFINQNKSRRQGVLDAYVNYFSPLATLRTMYIRQFIYARYTKGYGRYIGERELLYYNNPGIRGMGTPLDYMGTDRLMISSETVLFTPIYLYHFRFAFFAWGDCGWIGNNSNVFKNPFSAAAGVGVRIKNERLIFNNIQLSIGFSLQRPMGSNYNWFQVSNESTFNVLPFAPTRPTPYGFE